mmetsp:Transcript_11220/g.16590  ORF Transcript_11220/g.16590 Transcript_11220/m.16590 type:complete len:212 (-) Transcript_11220:33-668(-)
MAFLFLAFFSIYISSLSTYNLNSTWCVFWYCGGMYILMSYLYGWEYASPGSSLKKCSTDFLAGLMTNRNPSGYSLCLFGLNGICAVASSSNVFVSSSSSFCFLLVVSSSSFSFCLSNSIKFSCDGVIVKYFLYALICLYFCLFCCASLSLVFFVILFCFCSSSFLFASSIFSSNCFLFFSNVSPNPFLSPSEYFGFTGSDKKFIISTIFFN